MKARIIFMLAAILVAALADVVDPDVRATCW
jgi:hypothetical protein